MTPEVLAGEMLAAAASAGVRADGVAGEYAEKVAAAQRSAAPVGPTGATRDTISAERVAQGVWEAGTETWYAHFVEYGTSKRQPRPFIAPAGDRYADEFADAVAEVGDF